MKDRVVWTSSPPPPPGAQRAAPLPAAPPPPLPRRERERGQGGGGEVRHPRLLAPLLLALGLANLGKAVVAARYAALLPDLPMTVSWGYLIATGAFWGTVLTACGVALWRRCARARWAALAAATLFQAHVWLNHLLFDASDYARQTRPRDLLLTALFLAFTWGTLLTPHTTQGGNQ